MPRGSAKLLRVKSSVWESTRAQSRNALQRKPRRFRPDTKWKGRKKWREREKKMAERRSYGRERIRYATLLAALWSLLLKVSWGSYRSGEAFYSRGTLCIFTTGVRLRVRVLRQDLWGLRACYNGAECEHPPCQYSSMNTLAGHILEMDAETLCDRPNYAEYIRVKRGSRLQL